jgi:hypothetical protein
MTFSASEQLLQEIEREGFRKVWLLLAQTSAVWRKKAVMT